MKNLQFVKVKCQCGHVNLVPVIEVFHVYEKIKCEKCGKVLAEPNARALEKATKPHMFGEDCLKTLKIAVECMQQFEE